MSEQEGASGAKAALPAQQSLSQLIARILDQLSVSAWLPAGVLVLLILLVANLRLEDGRLLDAIGHLADIDLTALVLLAVVITLTTVLTQAFEFEAIRLLEGYWGPGLLPRACAELGCRRQLGRTRSAAASAGRAAAPRFSRRATSHDRSDPGTRRRAHRA